MVFAATPAGALSALLWYYEFIFVTRVSPPCCCVFTESCVSPGLLWPIYPISVLYHLGHVALQPFLIHVTTEARNSPQLYTVSVFHEVEMIYNVKYVGIHPSSREHFSFSHRWFLMKREGRLRSGRFLNLRKFLHDGGHQLTILIKVK